MRQLFHQKQANKREKYSQQPAGANLRLRLCITLQEFKKKKNTVGKAFKSDTILKPG